MPYNPAIHGAYVDAYDHYRQQNPQQANDWIDKLEKVIDDRIRKGKQEFLVKWKGYPSEENTWEPYNNLKDNQQFKNYQKKMKKKK